MFTNLIILTVTSGLPKSEWGPLRLGAWVQLNLPHAIVPMPLPVTKAIKKRNTTHLATKFVVKYFKFE
jgi:hypothetical protein